MSKEPIVPTGSKGFGFEQKGYQERNLESLLKILSNKEANKTLQGLAEIPEKEWSDMRSTASELRQFVEAGGVGQVFEDFKTSVRDAMTEPIEAALAPLVNELQTIINEAVAAFIETYKLDEFINDTAEFVRENPVGALIGALVGEAWGPTAGAFGGALGALLQYWGTGQWAKDLLEKQKGWEEQFRIERGKILARQNLPNAGLDIGEYHVPGGSDWDFSNISIDANGNLVISPPSAPRTTATFDSPFEDLGNLLDYGAY